MAAPFAFFDLRTPDVDSSRSFYTRLFGWEVADIPAGDAVVPLFVGGDGPWGGFTPLAAGDARGPQWLPYVTVDDIDTSTRAAVELGATVVRRAELPIGPLVSLTDPNGATFVLWQKAEPDAAHA